MDYIWRSDPELARLDAAYPLTMTYDRFLKIYQDQLKYPTPGSHHFAAVTHEGKFIGNCMYYDLDSVNMEAELGIVIGDRDYWGNAFGYERGNYVTGVPLQGEEAQTGLPAHTSSGTSAPNAASPGAAFRK